MKGWIRKNNTKLILNQINNLTSREHRNYSHYCFRRERRAMESWLEHLLADGAVWIWALAKDNVLCSWVRLTVQVSTQVYKWVLANLMLEATLPWTSVPSRGE